MTINTILLLPILLLFCSCNGQNIAQVADSTLNTGILDAAPGDTVKKLGNHLMHVFQDKNNNYWFGSQGEGLYRYDGKTILHFTTKNGLCHNKVENIQEDKSGNMYFNTGGGISKFDGQRFTTLKIAGNSSKEWKLNPDDLWFKGAPDSGVVYRYDGTLLHRLEFPVTKPGEEYIAKHPRSAYPNMKSSPYAVYSIYKDTKGNIWFGTGVLGACRYDGKSVDWISEDDVTELHDGPANGVRSIMEDKDGKFWFSNTLYRYNVYDDKSGFNYSKEKGTGSLDGRKNGDLTDYLSVTKDNNNELWIATYNAGVWRYDGKKITHYPVKDDNKTIALFSIYKDNNGDLWLGTHESGAYKFNGKTFERFRP